MKTKRAVIVSLVLIIVIAAFLSMTGRVIHAQASGPSDPALLAKLDALLDNQKTIMENLTAIKEELNIVKIRVTQSQ